MSENGEELIEVIAKMADCEYISNLHFPYVLGKIKEVVKGLDVNSYMAEEWAEAARYISGNEIPFDSAEAAKEYILHLAENHDGNNT